MTTDAIPIAEDRRTGERRSDWHTPETCFKLLDVQATVSSIYKQLEDGDIRMGCMEDNIAGNHRVVCEEIRDLKASLSENTEQTKEIFEIIQMGKGFFRTVGWIGKWIRRIVMWVVPPVVAIVGLWQSVRPPR